jgi:hypothetical protein
MKNEIVDAIRGYDKRSVEMYEDLSFEELFKKKDDIIFLRVMQNILVLMNLLNRLLQRYLQLMTVEKGIIRVNKMNTRLIEKARIVIPIVSLHRRKQVYIVS